MSLYPMPSSGMNSAELALHNSWRALWKQHVFWTRMAIISLANNLPDLPQVTARLLRNAPDMGALMRRYYGESIAAGYTDLIRKHLLIAIDLVSAAKKGDTAAAAAAEKAWYANADDIAAFMAGINPYWPEQTVKDMFYEHLALTKAEAEAILAGEHQQSIEIYDRIERQIRDMADLFTQGMIRQFGL